MAGAKSHPRASTAPRGADPRLRGFSIPRRILVPHPARCPALAGVPLFQLFARKAFVWPGPGVSRCPFSAGAAAGTSAGPFLSATKSPEARADSLINAAGGNLHLMALPSGAVGSAGLGAGAAAALPGSPWGLEAAGRAGSPPGSFPSRHSQLIGQLNAPRGRSGATTCREPGWQQAGLPSAARARGTGSEMLGEKQVLPQRLVWFFRRGAA